MHRRVQLSIYYSDSQVGGQNATPARISKPNAAGTGETRPFVSCPVRHRVRWQQMMEPAAQETQPIQTVVSCNEVADSQTRKNWPSPMRLSPRR